MNLTHAAELLELYLLGELSDAEARVVQTWLQENSAAAEMLAAAKDRLNRLDAVLQSPDGADALARKIMDSLDARVTRRCRRSQKFLFFTTGLAVAGCILVVVAATLFKTTDTTSGPACKVLSGAVVADGDPISNIPQSTAICVASDTPAVIRLSDGSQAELEPNARVVLHGSTQGRRQVVELIEGGGTFRVAKANGDFSVETRLGSVTALGTEFSVRILPPQISREPNVKMRSAMLAVAVIAGIVRVDVSGTSYNLGAGENRVFAQEQAAPAAADDTAFSVAVIHGTYGNGRHGDEFDVALRRVGWKVKKYSCTELKDLVSALDQYDMILACPLFNFVDKEEQDYGQYGERWKAFMSRGGAIVLTDCNYGPTLNWLEKIDPAMKADGTAQCKAQTPPAKSSPVHPMHFFPNVLRAGEGMWVHLTLGQSDRWEIVTRCGEGQPIAALQRCDKGFIYITNQRIANAETLENLRANLVIERFGCAVGGFEMPKLTVGPGEINMQLKHGAKSVSSIGLELQVKPEGQPAVVFRKEVKLKSNWAKAALHLPYRLSMRGPVKVRLALLGDLSSTTLLDRNVVLPELLELKGPRYRGIVSTARRTEDIPIGIAIAPDKEKIDQLLLRVRVFNAAGKKLGNTILQPPKKLTFRLPLPLGELAPGNYTVRGELVKAGEILVRREVKFTVVEPSPSQVVIDDDGVLLADGKPFFPIGIYHMAEADLPQIASLGMNMVHGWSWWGGDGKQFMDVAQQNNMKVVIEMGNVRSKQELERRVALMKDHPALVAWYVADEPGEADFDRIAESNATFHQLDLSHPTYMVANAPHLFSQQMQLADIFAVDPYPLPNGPLTMVSDWADAAQAATGGEKPVWLVPESFGRGTPAQHRVMAYLCLTHGARGIFWYPWDDGGTSGLKYHPELHPEFKKLTAEIRKLAPVLLGKFQRSFTASNGAIHGLVCGPEGPHCLIMVNATSQQQVVNLTVPEVKSAKLHEVFGDGQIKCRQGQLPLTFEPFGVKVYHW